MIPNYIAYNFLFAELLGRYVYIQDLPYIIFPILSLVLIFLIAKNILKGASSIIAPIIFIISPWFWYLVAAQSLYVFIFFLVLIAIYGIILVSKGQKTLGNIHITLSTSTLIYISPLFLILMPLFFTILLLSKTIKFKDVIVSLAVLVLLSLPLLFMVSQNKSTFESRLANETKIFSDPGLVNAVNRYQGAASEEGLRNIARAAENKYFFLVEFLTLKYTIQLSPVTFFTSEYKLLGFSFSPPILLGFIIPFGYGLFTLLQRQRVRKILLVSTLLVIPSVVSNEAAALNRLILFSPVIIFIITFGLVNLYNLKKNRIANVFLIITAVLIMFQSAIIVDNLRSKETVRFNRYFGSKYQLTEQ